MTLILQHDKRTLLADFVLAATRHQKIILSDASKHRVALSRKKLESFVEKNRIIYGVNTSCGGFVSWLVPIEHAQTLQENLINAVATNVGSYLDDITVRAIMLARIISLSRGNSAISLENLEKLIAIYNAGIIPAIPEKGSLGTSGDLGPLAAIALVCVGQWRAKYINGEFLPASETLCLANIEPMKLSFKEGLALINGTSGMVGLGSIVYSDAENLLTRYIDFSALSFEGLNAKGKPFDPRVHQMKPHKGQLSVAEQLWEVLKDSKLIIDEATIENILREEINNNIKQGTHQIEDAYSIRCTPQILGPIVDIFKFIKQTLEDELNSSNDNPLISPEDDEIFHNGHFHGQYVALAMDNLTIALTTLSNLANRRVGRFLDARNSEGLPPFLCAENPGLNLGLMGGQFMTASLTAENRSLCVPLSIQSLTSTADFQDIVSFGFVAARRAKEVLQNTKYIIAFELLCACQAVEMRGAEKLSTVTKTIYQQIREIVPFIKRDITITDYIEKIVSDVLTEKLFREHRNSTRTLQDTGLLV
ncbi:MAG: phenylalanine aminomutase (D-beta-phenylalanine forming) [Gammaproteobacteria bacterium RIFCSPLOWO2_02_FULL_38_11]|nr:MAG: phenylalanine aminomutase (D-beta-phenylalanine forming) [Gammaproteobacteria bacterium RIFCSPHIGHO2_12_38_15]OGT69486.1 MAG: phenylalanine aminomutase (D-beta-phenylalanine forming) [Gammaproteobacteria bacterium RIFCSPLOWO2_02_FULL_38_11]